MLRMRGVSVKTSQLNAVEGDFAPRVFLIKVRHRSFVNNNYLVIDPATQQAVVVDPAWEIDRIESVLDDTRATLSGVLVTHAHPDHIDLARVMADHHNCPIWMSREEIAFSGYSAQHLVAMDEQPWQVGGMAIRPILTPGHTPGCFCYLIGDNLFSGDVLFAEGCGICSDLKSAHAMFDSLQRLKAMLGPQVRIFPGHTYLRPPGQQFGEMRNYNMYLNFPDRDAFAAFRLRKGQSRESLLAFR